MGQPAKKKAVNDERKPRISSFSAFVCAQPFDIDAREITRIGRAAGYTVELVSSVSGARGKYPHLRFESGDAPTEFVAEFIAYCDNEDAKSYTISNSMYRAQGVEDRRSTTSRSPARGAKERSVSEVNAFVTRVLAVADEERALGHGERESVERETVEPAPVYRQALLTDPVDVEAPWGRRPDGTPRKKSGPKSTKNTLSRREKMVEETRQGAVVSEQPEQPLPATPRETPFDEAKRLAEETRQLLATAEQRLLDEVWPSESIVEHQATQLDLEEATQELEEDDDVSLQQQRDLFEIGDIVHVTQPMNGTVFTREGRIKDKESKRAVVVFGTVTDKIPYKRMSRPPQLNSGSGTAHANSNGAEIRPLRVVPPTFAQLRPTLASAPVVEKKRPALPPETPVEPIQIAEAVPVEALQKPVIAPPAPPPSAPPTPVVVASTASAPLTQQHKDLLAWLEMGTAFGDILPATEAALRAEVVLMDQEIARLTAERDAKLKQADTLANHIRLMSQVSGGVK